MLLKRLKNKMDPHHLKTLIVNKMSFNATKWVYKMTTYILFKQTAFPLSISALIVCKVLLVLY